MAGGHGYSNLNSNLDSTELLYDGASSWVEAAPLPIAMMAMRTVSVDNMIISTGE